MTDKTQASEEHSNRACHLSQPAGERTHPNFGLDKPALDLIISEKFLDCACTCDRCTKTFARTKKLLKAIEDRDDALKNLENNLEGEVNPEDQSAATGATADHTATANETLNSTSMDSQ